MSTRIPQVVRELGWPVLISLVGTAVLLAVVIGQIRQSERLDDARADRDRFAERLDAQQKTSEALARQVKALGGDPIVDPEDADEPVEEPDTDDSAEPIDKADLALIAQACFDSGECSRPLSTREAFDLVMRACDATGECEGDRGRRGPRPTFDQVLAAVEDLCDGSCEGKDGRTPTPEELQQLASRYFTTYCAEHNDCIGPMGPAGQDSTVPGPKGDAGRSYAGQACNPDGTWTIFYANPAGSETIPGPCKGQDGKDSTVPGPKGEPGTDGEDAPQPSALNCDTGGEPLTITLRYSDGTVLTAECGQMQPVDPESS